MREECRLRVFENRVLREMVGPKREEITREWRRLHNEELHELYCSTNNIWVNKSRKIRWAGHVARMGEMGGAYRVLMARTVGKKPTGKYRTIILKRNFKKWEGHGLD